MTLNLSIPGQMTETELNRLMALASRVPPGGIIVEVGCLYGLSSWHISKACQPGVTLFCVDPWERAKWIIDLVEKPQNAPPFSKQAFAHFTRDCGNIVMIQGYSPQIARGWKLGIDLYVEDAIHANPVLGQNIAFWTSRIKPGGIAAGHDHCADWPDVMSEADALAKRWFSKVECFDTLWSVARPA